MNALVKIRLVGARNQFAHGRVKDKAPKEAPVSLSVFIAKPPLWLRKLERKRGIFSTCSITMSLFLDYTNNWTDVQFGEHFTII